jgi:hypothetical protein
LQGVAAAGLISELPHSNYTYFKKHLLRWSTFVAAATVYTFERVIKRSVRHLYWAQRVITALCHHVLLVIFVT